MAARVRNVVAVLASSIVMIGAGIPVGLGAASGAEADIRPALPPATIAWEPCGPAECGDLVVPIDYADPDGPTITIRVRRVPATDPAGRRGVMLVNNGGPGIGGLSSQTPFDEHYDQIGFDPRGVGESSPLPCSFVSVDTLGISQLPSPPTTPAEEQQWVDAAADVESQCRGPAPAIFDHMGTEAVARDMDRIREALGEERISYVGHSYGSFLGAVYADLFPDRVDKFILDGPADPSDNAYEFATQYAVGSQRVFEHWAALCQADRNCAFNDERDVVARTEALVDQYSTHPVTYDDPEAGPFVVNGARIATMVVFSLFVDDGWPELGERLAAVEAGDLSYVASQIPIMSPEYWAISRTSALFPGDPAFVDGLADVAPVTGRYTVTENRITAMITTPVESRTRPVRAAGAPPILILAARWDPATGYDWATSLRDHLDSGVLVTWNGATHTPLASRDACVLSIARDFVEGIATPSREAGATCDTASLAASDNPDYSTVVPAPIDPGPTPVATPSALVPSFTG